MSSSPAAAATAGSPLPIDTPTSLGKPSDAVDEENLQGASMREATQSVNSSLSDVELFNGKIVYNPDGSAYIIEGPDSDGGQVEAEISQEGSITDSRGLTPNCDSFPQVVSAFHISRNSAAIYSALCGQSLAHSSKESLDDVPLLHSYRVFSFRNDKGDLVNGDLDVGDDDESKTSNCLSVPVKPILMCFLCKLSFSYTKSFITHATGEHQLVLNEEEERVLGSKNTSAIIQGLGKEKEPLLSFLKPKSVPTPFCPSSQQQQLDAQRLLAAQMAAVASALRSSSLPNYSSSPPLASLNNSVDKCSKSPSEVNNNSQEVDTDATLNDNSEEKSPSDDEGDASQSKSKHSPMDNSAQFASELADLANLEKFAKAAAAAAQQQIDLQSIAAAMAAAVAASNRTPSPKSTSKSSSSSSHMPISSSAAVNAFTTIANSILGNDVKCGTQFTSADSESSSLLTTIANHSSAHTRSSVNPSHPPLLMQHSRNSCKTLKCPKCNWHYKYQETLEIHMKEKHPENEMSCIYCLTNQAHPRLARGETYTCGYKPYRCDVCNYSTTTKGNLSIHMQSDKHINNVQELQNGNIPATAEHLLQSQALAAAVAQASAAANGNGMAQSLPTNVSSSSASTGPGSNSASPVPSQASANLAAMAAAQQEAKTQMQKMNHQQSSSPTTSSSNTPSSTPNSSGSKQKATWRCDVCNYETNVARNLRIHMTSEKHTHNIMVLKQNVTQMQQLTALQQAGILSSDQLLQFNPGLFAAAAAAAMNSSNSPDNNGVALQPEAALADMAYNHALLMMASQQQQQQAMASIMRQQNASSDCKSPSLSMSNGMQPTFDIEQPDPSFSGVANVVPYDDSCRLFHCCVCTNFTTDSIEELNQHILCDRTRTREDEVLASFGGNYICKLCSYKTNLKANFQLHCKTDKHLQKLQQVNHIKEGGPQAEWKLKFVNVSNPVQVRCNVCDYYTNSIHKLQLHTSDPRHEVCSRIFAHLQSSSDGSTQSQYYFCSLCQSATRTKIALIQHLNSAKHSRNEASRQMKQQAGHFKQPEEDIFDMLQVKLLNPEEKIVFDSGKCNAQFAVTRPSLHGVCSSLIGALQRCGRAQQSIAVALFK